MSELEKKSLPYLVRINSTRNGCRSSINKSSTEHISNKRLWIQSNYTECGMKIYHVGDTIAFEQEILVEYGSKDQSSSIYRFLSAFFTVKCFLDRKITQSMNISVQEYVEISPTISKHFF